MGKHYGRRVQLSLRPDLVLILDRIKAVAGIPYASFIRQFLEQAKPQLELMVKTLEEAQAQKIDAFETLRKAVDLTTQQSAQASLELKAIDKGFRTALRQSKSHKRKRTT